MNKELNNLFEKVDREIGIKDIRISYLEKENKKLKDEKYKDLELQKMKKELEDMKKECYNGFPITEEEKKKIEEWKNKHEQENHGLKTLKEKNSFGGAIGGTYTYEFIPTSIGVIGIIKCSCGEEFTFSDI